MGVSLDYYTSASVPPTVRDTICAEAKQLRPPDDWWGEGLNIRDLGDGRLGGGSKTLLYDYDTADGSRISVDSEEDSLMSYRDTRFILEKLGEWSQRFQIKWLVYHVEAVGAIAKGQWDAKLRRYVEELKGLFPWPASFEDKAKAVSAKHATRCW